MPRSGVLAHAPFLPSLHALVELKRLWIVSVAALAYRLHDLGLIKDWHYRALCIEIAQRGYRRQQPDEAPREMSLVLGKVFHSLRSDGISKGDVARDLKWNPEDMDNAIFRLLVTGLRGGVATNVIRERDRKSLIHRLKEFLCLGFRKNA